MIALSLTRSSLSSSSGSHYDRVPEMEAAICICELSCVNRIPVFVSTPVRPQEAAAEEDTALRVLRRLHEISTDAYIVVVASTTNHNTHASR